MQQMEQSQYVQVVPSYRGMGVNCSSAVSGCDHGTHIAGIVAGKKCIPFSGVARDANLISIQIFSQFLRNI